jgi:5-methylcytosine-specific restriction endonuclease McrA
MDLQLPFDNEERLSIEHLVPLAEGGTNDIENLVLAHQSCQNEVNLKSQDYAERAMEFNRTREEFYESQSERQTALAEALVKVLQTA